MLKIAKDFFDYNIVDIKNIEEFFESDLCKYFEMLYKKKLVVSSSGFIKIVKKQGFVRLLENVFKEYGDPSDQYITFEGINFNKGDIEFSNIGSALSTHGYARANNTRSYIEDTLYKLPILPFSDLGCERATEPSRTLKFNSNAWGKPNFQNSTCRDVYKNVERELKRVVSFSPILSSMDAFDCIALEWNKGRRILPHNDVDFRMFVNMVSYNTENSGSRYLCTGSYDWYDYMFHSIITEDWEATNNIVADRKEENKIWADTNISVLVNVFNPRFYHEVSEFHGPGKMYSIPSHLSMHSIVDQIKLKR